MNWESTTSTKRNSVLQSPRSPVHPTARAGPSSPSPGTSAATTVVTPEICALMKEAADATGLEIDDSGSGDNDDDYENEDDEDVVQNGNYFNAGRSVYALSLHPRKRRQASMSPSSSNGHDGATIDSARTIYPDDFDFVTENGRQYCGDYFMPIDEEERVRQYAIHETYLRLFNKQLTTVPLNDPRYILDIGTGIGEWAIAMAERYPRAEVFGTDIAPIQPTHQVPFNVEFHIEDAEDEWIRPADTVDLVHLRNLEGAFSDWSFIYSQAFACLKPGGWIEILDWDNVLSNGNFLSCFPDDSPAHQLVSAVLRAAEIAGKPRDAGHLDPALLRASGFVDVRETVYDLSMSTHDDAAASYRQFWLFSVVTGFEPMCLRMLTKYLGMDPDEAKSLCREVAMETKKVAEDPQRAQRFVVKLRVVVARKPLPGEEVLQQQHQRFREVNGSARDLSGDESTIGPATIRSDDTI